MDNFATLLDLEFGKRCEMAIEHVAMHHGHKADGYVCFAVKRTEAEMKQKGTSYPWTQRFFKYEDLVRELPSLLATYYDRDVYFSANTMWKRRRVSEGVRHMRCIFADLDTYKVGLSPSKALRMLEEEVFGKVLPWPNRVVFSGQGLWLYWDIEPVPQINKADFAGPFEERRPPEQRRSPAIRWGAVQRQFNYLLKDYGADFASIDPVRVCRLAGTYNSKSGELAECLVYDDEHRYSLAELKEMYLPVLPELPAAKKRNKKAQIHYLDTEMNFFYRLKCDLEKLLELRNGDISCQGSGWEDKKAVRAAREYFLFMFRMSSERYHGDGQKALEDTLEINQRLKNPLPVKEVHGDTGSRKAYRYKPRRVIELFGISVEEQKEMEYLAGPVVKKQRKQERDREYQATKRAEAGVMPREERKAAEVDLLAEAIAKEPGATLGRLAEQTGLSRSKCHRLKKDAENAAFQKNRLYIVEDCSSLSVSGCQPSSPVETVAAAECASACAGITSVPALIEIHSSELGESAAAACPEDLWYDCLELLEQSPLSVGLEASFELLLRSAIGFYLRDGTLIVQLQNDFARIYLAKRFLAELNNVCVHAGLGSIRFEV